MGFWGGTDQKSEASDLVLYDPVGVFFARSSESCTKATVDFRIYWKQKTDSNFSLVEVAALHIHTRRTPQYKDMHTSTIEAHSHKGSSVLEQQKPEG